MSYWLVVSIMVCAALAVSLVLVWSLRSRSARPEARRWVALGMSGIGPDERRANWAGLVHERVPEVECVDLTAPGSRIAEVRHNQLGPALSAQPVAAVLWVGAEDLLSGVALETFRQDFAFILDQLARAHCHLIIIEMPSVEPNPAKMRRGWSHRAVGSLIAEWSDEIRRIAAAYRTHLVRASDGRGSSLAPMSLGPPGTRFSPDALHCLADRVTPILRDLVHQAPPDWTPDEPWEQPQDPVQRHELGLPLF